MQESTIPICNVFSSMFPVPPQLAPIAFMGGTTAGLRAQAMCLVLAGDAPVTLRWLKNDRQLIQADGVRITQSSDFTSSIAIDRTLGEHAGNYSCLASNSAGTTASSAVLTVNGKPSETPLFAETSNDCTNLNAFSFMYAVQGRMTQLSDILNYTQIFSQCLVPYKYKIPVVS